MLGRLLIAITACHALISPRLLVQRAPALKSTVADAVNKGKAEKGKVSFLKTAYPVASAATTLAARRSSRFGDIINHISTISEACLQRASRG